MNSQNRFFSGPRSISRSIAASSKLWQTMSPPPPKKKTRFLSLKSIGRICIRSFINVAMFRIWTENNPHTAGSCKHRKWLLRRAYVRTTPGALFLTFYRRHKIFPEGPAVSGLTHYIQRDPFLYTGEATQKLPFVWEKTDLWSLIAPPGKSLNFSKAI